eukprot:307391-Ditylum_brightwellii.AAC.1
MHKKTASKDGYNVIEDAGKSTSDHHSTLRRHIDTMLSGHCKEYKVIYQAVSPKLENCDLLAYKAADQYFSAFKTYFMMQKFNTQPCPRPFEDRFWSVYRRNILDCKEGKKGRRVLEAL